MNTPNPIQFPEPMSDAWYSMLSRLDKKIRIDEETGDWVWLGAPNSVGYGRFYVNAKEYQAHRVVYELLVGPIPEETPHLDHTHCSPEWCEGGVCEHRITVTPWNLKPSTIKDNVLRGNGACAQHARKTECPRCGGQYTRTKQGDRICKQCYRDYHREYQRARRASRKAKR